jgi:hypothetical protein
MADDGGTVLRIANEGDAWAALSWLLQNRKEAASASINLESLDWASFSVTYRGRSFHQTVTASLMRGLVEYQTDLYRAFARLTKEDGRVSKLTDEEKEQLELVFAVKEGSSEIRADAKSLYEAIKIAVRKMNGRQSLIAIIVLILVFFGTAGAWHYLDTTVESQRIQAEEKGREIDATDHQALYDLLQKLNDTSKSQILNNALKASPTALDISEYSSHAYGEIVRNSVSAESITIHGTDVDSKMISLLTKTRRAKSENFDVKTQFYVTGTDTTDRTSYRVQLQSVDGELDLIAELDDPLLSNRYQSALSHAEWSGEPVTVQLTARRVGPMIKDAKIIRAYKPRQKRV